MQKNPDFHFLNTKTKHDRKIQQTLGFLANKKIIFLEKEEESF